MKRKIKQIITFFLSVIVICNTFYCSCVYASEDKSDWVVIKDVTDEMKPINKLVHKGKNLMFYLLAQCGALVNANIDTLYDNTEWLEKVDNYSVVVRNTTTGELVYRKLSC